MVRHYYYCINIYNQSFSGRKKNAISQDAVNDQQRGPSNQLDSPSSETKAEITEAAVREISSS